MTTPDSHAMPLRKLLAAFDAVGEIPDVVLSGLALDSRKVHQGYAYLAVQGTQAHGLDYLESALSAGAIAVFVDADDVRAAQVNTGDVHLVRVPDLSANAGVIASLFYNHPTRHMDVCGVTGTDGKTSVCRFISESLRHVGIKAGYIGTIGWGIDDDLEPNPLTTPDPISLQYMFASLRERGATCVAIEISSHALDQGRINGVALDIAVLTNLGRDHLDYHGTVENYRAAKEKLFYWPGLRGVVLNSDDAFGRQLQADLHHANTSGDLRITAYSLKKHGREQASIIAADVTANTDGVLFSLLADETEHEVSSRLLGLFNVQNLLASYGALRLVGVAADDAVSALTKLQAVPGRMEHFRVAGGANAVVDYAHTPQALEAAIKTLRHHCAGTLTVVFGCGGDRDKGKRKVMGEVASEHADRIIVTDDNPRTESPSAIIDEILAGIRNGTHVRVIGDRGTAIAEALENAANDDWVLVAGKGHEDYQIVGDARLDFSDREVVSSVLERLHGSAGARV